MMLRLARVKLKVERAKEHVRDLPMRVNAFRPANPDLFIGEHDQQAGETVYKLQRELPDSFALIVGDCINNLRSSLDHLVCRLIEAHSGPVADIEFSKYPLPDKLNSSNKRSFEASIAG